MVKRIGLLALAATGCSAFALDVSGLAGSPTDGGSGIAASGGGDRDAAPPLPSMDAAPPDDATTDGPPAPMDASHDSATEQDASLRDSAVSDSATGGHPPNDSGGVLPSPPDASSDASDGGTDAKSDAATLQDASSTLPLLMFVTLGTYSGELNGLAGADTICAGEAYQANIPGTFRAWLSDGISSPATRFTHPAAGYILLNGAVVAASWTELVTTGPRVPIDITRSGSVVTPAASEYVWTATAADGTAGVFTTSDAGTDCQAWTSQDTTGATGGLVGDSLSTSGWTSLASPPFACGSGLRLYCVEQ